MKVVVMQSPPVNSSDCLYEIIRGKRVVVLPMDELASAVASNLNQLLAAYVSEQKLGAIEIEQLFWFRPPVLARRPDLAFVSAERCSGALIQTEDEPAFDLVPNLAAELISSSDTAREIEDELRDYFAGGVQMVWVVHPIHRRIYVHESPTKVRVLTEHDELDGGSVIPGFKVRIADLYARLVKPASSSVR